MHGIIMDSGSLKCFEREMLLKYCRSKYIFFRKMGFCKKAEAH
jgi:hypothetical protein